MDELDPLEQGTHTFSGIVRVWGSSSGELVTDSGLVIFLDTRGQPPIAQGARVTVVTRRYRPCHLVTRVSPA